MKLNAFHTFIQQIIKKKTQQMHINSSLFQADKSSVGICAEECLAFMRWLKGPEYLQKERVKSDPCPI